MGFDDPAADGRPMSALTEGQIHDSAAEVVDAPLLILRIAQSRAETTRLIDWLRGMGARHASTPARTAHTLSCNFRLSSHKPPLINLSACVVLLCTGLGAEGQISQSMMRRALAAIGVHSPTLGEQIAECYEVLDPEATGTMSFSELHSELRRVRKLLTPMSGPATGGAGSRKKLQRGSSAPLQRAPQGFRHEDGSPYTAVELENAAANFRRQGELGQALRALEAALAYHSRVHGERSEVAIECSRQVADVCNSLGMQMLQRDDFVGCHALLRRAQARGQGDRAMFAITLNNLACYHRRRGHLKVALAHLSKAVDIESNCDGAHKPADTHLNLCAVQSELGNHHEAMHHAKLALRLLREELGLPPPTPHSPSSGLGRGFSASGLLTGDAPPPSAERMAVLAIAHHNLAVEQEALRLPEEATRSFGEAASIAAQQLGEEHPVATALRSTFEANLQQRERQANAERRIAMAQRQNSGFSLEQKRAAELRKQQSVQRHIETVRLMRRDGSARLKRSEPHERRNPDGVPKILAGLGEDGDVAGALREWLAKNASKVMNLFKTWDIDGSGTIDKAEFRRAMRALGLQAPGEYIDLIFDEFDQDGGGDIEFKELNRLLRQGSGFKVQSLGAAQEKVQQMKEEAAARKAKEKAKKLENRPGSAPAPPPSRRARGGDGRDDGFSNSGDAPTGGASSSDLRPEADDIANEHEEEAFEVGMRQNAMEYDAADVNKDRELDFAEFCAMIREREAGEHTEAELRARFNSIDENNNNRIDLDEFIRYSLRDALQRSSSRVIDLFREWDHDESGSIDAKEFRKAIKALGFDATDEEINGVFKQLDVDGSGSIEYKELNKKLRSGAGSSLDPALRPGAMGEIKAKGENKHALRRGKMSGKKNAVLASSVQLEPVENGKSVIEQLKEILNKNAVRVIDLFRSWDEDMNGKIDAKEFRNAISALGYKAPKADVDALFGAFDVDGTHSSTEHRAQTATSCTQTQLSLRPASLPFVSTGGGEIDYNELNKALRRGAEIDPKLRAGGAGEIQTKAKLASPPRPKTAPGEKKGSITAMAAVKK